MQRHKGSYLVKFDRGVGIPMVMSIEQYDKKPRKQCHCGVVISKYNKRNWCRACQRKGKDNDPKE